MKAKTEPEEVLDEAALNEEASRELEALVAAEVIGSTESEYADDAGAYAVQSDAERIADHRGADLCFRRTSERENNCRCAARRSRGCR